MKPTHAKEFGLAEKKRAAMERAVQHGTHGWPPNPPKGCPSLTEDIALFTGIVEQKRSPFWRVEVDVRKMLKREIKYLLKVCRSLGYKPRW